MAGTLIDRFLARAVRKGVLDLTHADGRSVHFGEPCAGFPQVAIRFADERVGRQIMLDPRLGAAEAFIDGRLVIELDQHDRAVNAVVEDRVLADRPDPGEVRHLQYRVGSCQRD